MSATSIGEFSLPLARSLFRNLHAATETAAAYRTIEAALAPVLADAPLGSVLREVTAEQLDRVRDLVREMDEDAEDRRDAILSAGFTPAQYEAWEATR